MRITFLLPPVNMSGGIKVPAIYADRLRTMGHDVVLISPLHKAVSFKRKLKLLLLGGGWSFGSAVASQLDGMALDHRVLECNRAPNDADVPDADVIIATWWETAEWANALADSKGVRVYFVQGHEVFTRLSRSRCEDTYHLPFHKIVPSRWLKDIMENSYGDMSVDLVPNSVDHSQFFGEERDKQPVPTIGFLYSPSLVKGADIMLRVLDRLRDRFPDLRVISFGSKIPKSTANFDSRIEFSHSPEQNKIRDLYAQCDVWLSASTSEGFNLPAMEAMACRTPVVSTKTGWPEEAIIDAVNGYLADADDVEKLVEGATAILSLANDAWRKMSSNSFKTVEDCSWDASTELFEKALLSACSRSRKGEVSGSCTQFELN